MMKLRARFFCGFAFVFLCHSVHGRISANEPAGAESYFLVDWLEAYDCAFPTLRELQPTGHHELRETLFLGKDHAPCEAPEWLMKERQLMLRPMLQNDFRSSLLLLHNDKLPLLGIDSSITPLYPLRENRATANGPNLYLEFNFNAEAGRDWGIALSATPGWSLGWDNYQSWDGRFYLLEGYIKAGYKQAEFTWGRTALRFGNTRHGSLILTGAARPVDLIKFAVRPSAPIESIGPFTFDTWLADQGDTTYIPRARLWGTELGWRPNDFLELAFLELYQYGGAGAPQLTTSDYFKMLYYANDTELHNKRSASFTTMLNGWLPHHWAKLYTQLHFKQLSTFSHWFTDDSSVLLGAWIPQLWGGDVRAEYVHTVPTAYEDGFWRQGLTYQGTPLGHPIGPDGEAVYLDVGLGTFENWRPSAALFYEARAKNPPPGFSTEWRYGLGVEATRRWTVTELNLSTRYASVRNSKYVHGATAALMAAMATFKYSFF